MEKKYQVFVSSTYEDLQEERKKVMEALLQMNCFPVGMEYFNASDASQWEVIKSLIRECDYYVLIVAGRYGSIEEESGKSYTQKEFEYAIEQCIPIISFVHQNSNTLPGIKLESEPEKKMKLEELKSDVQKRLCKFWSNADGLASQVVLSLNSLIKTAPRIGWVRADEISSADANKEILALRKENEELIKKIEKIQMISPTGSEKLQQGEDPICLHFVSLIEMDFDQEYSWNELFAYIAPFMINEQSEESLKSALRDLGLRKRNVVYESSVKLLSDDFYTIIIQLSTLGLIEQSRSVKGSNTYWTLTPLGKKEMTKLKILKKV